MLIPDVEVIVDVDRCGFRHSRITADHVFFFRQIYGEKWENVI
jgi:hypothetical protein